MAAEYTNCAVDCFLGLTREERTELLLIVERFLDCARIEQRRTDILEYRGMHAEEPRPCVSHDESILWSLVRKLRELER